jgi:hypothetical protein
MIITQGNPEETNFADIFPRYEAFINWYGFSECQLIRACGLSPQTTESTLSKYLAQAD